MRADPAYRPITAEEFLAMDFGTDKRFELDNGVIYMMTGGTEGHAWVQGNIFAWLKRHLKGSGCRPYGPDMGVRISDHNVRYPDISVFCSPTPREELANALALPDPAVIIEVLSPSTTRLDQGTKLEQYQGLPSVCTIAFVDPVNELCSLRERAGPGSWNEQLFSGSSGIAIPTLRLHIPHDEIFARD